MQRRENLWKNHMEDGRFECNETSVPPDTGDVVVNSVVDLSSGYMLFCTATAKGEQLQK